MGRNKKWTDYEGTLYDKKIICEYFKEAIYIFVQNICKTSLDCVPIWSPYHVKDIEILEKVQPS